MNQIQLLALFNEASRDELTALSGIGPALADRLIAARPFESLSKAKEVSGITAKLLDRLVEADPEADSPPAVMDQVMEYIQTEDEKHTDEVFVEETLTDPVSQYVDEDKDAPVPQDGNVSSAEARLSDFREAFKEKSQALGDGLTELGANVGKRGKATMQSVGEISDKIEQSTKNRGQFWMILVSSTITALVSIMLTLAVLGGINGSLKFTTGSQYAVIQREAAQIVSQVDMLRQELDGLRGRVDKLEGFGERTAALEQAQEQLAAEVQTASQQVSDMENQVIALNEKITQQEERTQRFDSFSKELQTLLGSLFAPQGETQ